MSQYSLQVVNEVLKENGIPWRATMPADNMIVCTMTHGDKKALFAIFNADFEHDSGRELCYVYLTAPEVKDWTCNINTPLDWLAFADVMCEFFAYGIISGVEMQTLREAHDATT